MKLSSSTPVTWLTTLAVFVTVALIRFYYVNHYAVALPYWDQWDAEGDFLLRPWIEGRFKIQNLWDDHNEHRILPTRILSLIIFNITGEWNNLTEARVNIFLAAAIPAFITWLLVRAEKLTWLKWCIVPVIVAQFALPFSYENLLVGFQSQFYFLVIFTVVSLATISFNYLIRNALPIVILLCVLAIVTMGSGIFTPLSVAAIFGIRWYQNRNGFKDLAGFLILVALAIAGYFTIPNLGVNTDLKSQSAGEFLLALQTIFSWPYTKASWAVLLWLPGFAGIFYLLFRKTLSPTDIFMAGCFTWSLLQALAIAYGRGHQLIGVSSRYTELFSIGLISNAWFAVRLAELAGRKFAWTSLAFFVLLLNGHRLHYKRDVHDIAANYQKSLLQIRNISLYLKTGDRKHLDQPMFEIPYPKAERLEELLNVPAIRGILPEDLKRQ